MQLRAYFIGIVVSTIALYIAFTDVSNARWNLYVLMFASSYIVYSTLAVALSYFGRSSKSKAWVYFLSGIALLFVYLPSLEKLAQWFYVPTRYDDRVWFQVTLGSVYLYSPLIVSSLCIFRGITHWADESIRKPNQPTEPPSPSLGGSS